MITLVNPVYQNPLLRHVQPRMGQLTPLVPPVAPPSTGGIIAGTAAGVVTLALGGLSVAFLYGVAKESKSKWVKTPGYILAGVTGLAVALEALGVGVLVAKSSGIPTAA
jgi:hypothetical protein